MGTSAGVWGGAVLENFLVVGAFGQTSLESKPYRAATKSSSCVSMCEWLLDEGDVQLVGGPQKGGVRLR